MPLKEDFLNTGLFIEWGGDSRWLVVKGTNLVYCYQKNTTYNARWFICDYPQDKQNKLNLGPRDLSEHFGFTTGMVNDSKGLFVKKSTEEVITLLPEDLKESFLYELDLFTDGS